MNRQALKDAYRIEDDVYRLHPNAARYGGTYFGLAERIKRTLSYQSGWVEVECFNDVEAELVSDQLTQEERSRVKFTCIFVIPKETK